MVFGRAVCKQCIEHEKDDLGIMFNHQKTFLVYFEFATSKMPDLLSWLDGSMQPVKGGKRKRNASGIDLLYVPEF